jgi:hypothetical protein
MLVIWLGALLVLGGLVFLVAQPIWRGRLSEARRRRSSAVPRDTLEPHTLEPHTLEPRRGSAARWARWAHLVKRMPPLVRECHRAR